MVHTQLLPRDCTLHKVRKIWEAIADEAALEPYAHLQLDVHASTVRVVLAFPGHALSLVAQVMTRDFLAAQNIVSVFIDGKSLQSYIEMVSYMQTQNCRVA